jgi:HPt (histidine-containing phosphotransfer) domain-containing protein
MATPDQAGASQNESLDSGSHGAAHPAAPARMNPGATDDEILGLTTNLRRRDSTASHGLPGAESRDPNRQEREFSAAEQRGVSKGKESSSSTRSAAQPTAAAADGTTGADPEDVAAEVRATAGPGGEPAHLQAAFAANPELRTAWHDAKSYRETFATPEEAKAATGMLADLNRMDALFFSHRPEDHEQLARAVADLDPAAFASLARAMSQVAQSVGVTFPAIAARSASGSNRADARSTFDAVQKAKSQEQIPRTASRAPENQGQNRSTRDYARDDSSLQGAANTTNNNALPSNSVAGVSPAQEQFFHAANAAAVEGVVEAIETQVERLLPEGISKSARNRVVGEIYRELDSTLRSNRILTQQMRDAFRSGTLDANHQKAVVSLITGRARQALPAVAKRVLNEWTTTIVSANQQRRERQRTAERRVDIGGAGGAGNEGRHSMGPREINYARMSDADILNL